MNNIENTMFTKSTDLDCMYIGMREEDLRRYSFGRIIAASLEGDPKKASLEWEACECTRKKTGQLGGGILVPFDVWIPWFREKTTLGSLGVRPLCLRAYQNLELPYAPSLASQSSAKIALSPKRMCGTILWPRETLVKSDVAVESLLLEDLLENLTLDTDKEMMNVLRNTLGVGSVVSLPDKEEWKRFGRSSMFSNDWSMAVPAFFGALEILIGHHNSVTDDIEINLIQHLAFAIRQPDAFAVMDDALTS